MDKNGIKYFFLGIGGIGMSSLAKYLFDKGYRVMGYDKTSSRINMSDKKDDKNVGDDSGEEGAWCFGPE